MRQTAPLQLAALTVLAGATVLMMSAQRSRVEASGLMASSSEQMAAVQQCREIGEKLDRIQDGVLRSELNQWLTQCRGVNKNAAGRH